MPTTGMGLWYPASTAPPRVWEDIQALATSVDTLLDLPDAVASSVNATISVTATALATLPTPLSISITNPSAVYNMEVGVSFSAWLTVATDQATAITVGVAGSGGMTWGAASFGAGGPIGNSDNLFFNGGPSFTMQHSEYPIIIPAGAAAVTLTMQAFRSNTTRATNCNYPTLRAKPRRFLVP